MPNQTEAALTRHWSILITLIGQILRGVAAGVVLRAGQRRKMLHRLRLTESLARRWLMLRAQSRALGRDLNSNLAPKLANGPETPATLAQVAASAPPRRRAGPLFCLVEPEPALRPEDYSNQPFETGAPGLARFETPEAEAPPSRAMRQRAAALLDVLQRPQHHAARMARWLRRAAGTSRTRFVRRHPLRVGRPPGARRCDRAAPEQAALWWLDTLARDSLLPGWVP